MNQYIFLRLWVVHIIVDNIGLIIIEILFFNRKDILEILVIPIIKNAYL